MQTIFTGGATRMWLYAGDPDSSVHTAGGVSAEAGEIFLNTTTKNIFFCYQGGATNQLWQQFCYWDQAQQLAEDVPQADWSQSDPLEQDYILNKPSIPSPQIQADWTQASNAMLDYIKNKPSIPAAQIQSDWAQANNTLLDFIKNKPSLATVATSGNYADLTNKPTIPSAQIQSDWSQANNASVDFIKNKPSIPAAQIQSDWTQSVVGALDYIKNKPTLSTVATSGAYVDLTGKPSLATVATSGSYVDLSNKPTIPAAQVQSDWTQAVNSAVDFIKNKPTFAAVATSGSYNDLSNKPTIPAAQIQSDWNQANASALDFIKNKPTINTWTQSAATRTLNTIFQVSATRGALVRYSVDISSTVSLSGGGVGRVVLEMATNSAFTTGVQELQSFGNGNTGTLVVGLVLTQLGTACVSGFVPAGYYARLRTVNSTGTPTFTYISGQEVLV